MQFDRAIAQAQVVAEDLTDDQAVAMLGAERVACDVETTGLDWRSDRVALVQLYAPGAGPVLIQIGERVPLRLLDVLAAQDVVKVFHHAPFDLRFICSRWSVRPSAVACTKVASKLLTPQVGNSAHSLQSLVAKHLGIELDKGAVRVSDWAAGTLSAEQVRYAAGDVVVLLDLHDALRRSLASAEKARLYESCCAFLPTQVELTLGDYPDVFAY